MLQNEDFYDSCIRGAALTKVLGANHRKSMLYLK